MKLKNNYIRITILALTFSSFACTIFVGGPKYPSTPIAVSTEALGDFEQQVQAAKTSSALNGILTLTINETQITSLLASKLDSQPEPFIQNPQVYLRDGEIQVYGQALQANIKANVRIVLTASLDPEGKPIIKVISTDFGPFPAPQGLNETVTSFIDQAFTGAIGPAATGLRIESINISDGFMTISGHVK